MLTPPVVLAVAGTDSGGAAVAANRDHLLPTATVATPNLDEARALTGRDAPAPELAARLADLGCAVVLTGGPEWRPGGSDATCTDWLCEPGGTAVALPHPAVPTTADHGSGCTYASALAARLAHGDVLAHAANSAAAYVADRLDDSSGWGLGRGRGPVSHLAPSRPATRVGPWRAARTSGTGDRSRDGCGCRSSG